MPSVKIIGKTADTVAFERKNLIEKLTEMVESDSGLYGLNWPGKYTAHNFAYTPTTKTLRPDKANSVDWDNTENLFITGDNLDILKLLRKNYTNKIDMIYIDPPYNTGGNDFVYKDNYSDSSKEYLEKTEQGLVSNPVTAGRRHSNWLSMMLSRLLLAKELLKDTGVIFISIDDNEQANLKLLCDEVFGERNFVGGLIHQRAKGGGQAKYIVKGHDYILLYSKQINNIQLSRRKVVQSKIVEINGEQYLRNDDVIRKTFGKYDKSNGDRRCFYEELEQYKGINKKNEIDEKIRNGEYVLEDFGNGYHVIVEYEKVQDAKSKLYSIIKVLSEKGKEDLEEIELDKYFDYPKPVELIKQIIEAGSNDESLILDFFAGSGTTAHAVEKLNAEDNGNRKWILCQIDESCEKENFKSIDQISRERIRRIGASFRAFKLDTSNYTEQFYTPSDWTKKEIWEHSKEFIKSERSIEDICFGIMLEKGIPLTAKISHTDYGIYAESEDKLLFVVNKKLDTNAAREIAEKIKEQVKGKSYVYIYPSSFIDDAAKINCIQFFENIENVELLEM